MRKLLATVNDNTLTLMRLLLGWSSFCTAHKRCLGGLAALGFRAR